MCPTSPISDPAPDAADLPREQRGEWTRNDLLALAAIAVCVVANLALDLLAARTSPWLDEVWTFELVPRIMRASDVLFGLPHANNHPLNTLYLYALGDVGDRFVLYRLHSIAAGAAATGLAAAFAWRFGRAAAVFAALLVGSSFLVVHQASQARGYAMMVAFGLAAALALARDHDAPRVRTALAYAVCTALAFLSNLYYLHTFVALSVWSAVVLGERALGSAGSIAARARRFALSIARLHLPALAAFAFIAASFYLPGLTGTQFTTDHRGIVVQAVSLTLGGPFVGPTAERLAVVGALAGVAALLALLRDRDRSALLFALAIVLAPAFVLTIAPSRALFVRFFFASEVFGLLLLATLLGALARRHWAGALAACAVALAIVAANASHLRELVRYGRGDYDAAFRYMASETVGGAVTVASDHVLGMRLMTNFYGRLRPEDAIVFDPEPGPANPPRFFVRVATPWPPELQLAGHLYERDRLFRTSGFGWDWQLYRLVPMADALRRKGIDPARLELTQDR